MRRKKDPKPASQAIDFSRIKQLKEFGLSEQQIANHFRTPEAPPTPLSMSLPFFTRQPFRAKDNK